MQSMQPIDCSKKQSDLEAIGRIDFLGETRGASYVITTTSGARNKRRPADLEEKHNATARKG